MDVIADNTVLTNFALLEREALLLKLFSGCLYTSDEVIRELSEGEQRGLLPKRNWTGLKPLSFESEHEKQTFELIRKRLGTGESACLAIAAHRDLKILTDDLDARRLAQKRGIAVSGTIGVLVLAVKTECISVQEGNRLVSELIEHGFYSPYKNLEDLI